MGQQGGISVYDESYKELASAIIGQACKDYVDGKHQIEIEVFLKSDWFATLTDMDGQKLLQGLKAQLKEKESKKKQRRKQFEKKEEEKEVWIYIKNTMK